MFRLIVCWRTSSSSSIQLSTRSDAIHCSLLLLRLVLFPCSQPLIDKSSNGKEIPSKIHTDSIQFVCVSVCDGCPSDGGYRASSFLPYRDRPMRIYFYCLLTKGNNRRRSTSGYNNNEKVEREQWECNVVYMNIVQWGAIIIIGRFSWIYTSTFNAEKTDRGDRVMAKSGMRKSGNV